MNLRKPHIDVQAHDVGEMECELNARKCLKKAAAEIHAGACAGGTISAEAMGAQRGAVLILVLVSMSVVSVLGALMIREIAANYASTSSVRTTMTVASLFDSGMLLACDVLMRDKDSDARNADHLFEEWARFENKVAFVSAELTSGSLNGTIIDEGGRFPLRAMFEGNEAVRKQYEAIFVRMVNALCRAHRVPPEGAQLLASLKNWVSGEGHSEDDWYQRRQPAYKKPGRLPFAPAEILLVRWEGLTKDQQRMVYWGTDAIPGLFTLLSIWSPGPINMNTAPSAVLFAMVSDGVLAREFVALVREFRNNPANRLDGTWYVDIARYLGMAENSFAVSCATVTSNHYRVRLQGQVGAGVRRFESVVKIGSGRSECLYRRTY